jgi:hypothetical protein
MFTTTPTTMTSNHSSVSKSYKSTYETASKTADTDLKTVVRSLFSAGAFNNVPSSDPPLPSGASFLLEIHRRREQSAFPSQKMKRKERDYIEKYSHPSPNKTNMNLSLPTKSAAPRQSMTKEELNSLLGYALDLMSED